MQTDGGKKTAVDLRVDKQFIRGTTAALRSWLRTNVPTLICLCETSSCKACPGANKTRKPLSLALGDTKFNYM